MSPRRRRRFAGNAAGGVLPAAVLGLAGGLGMLALAGPPAHASSGADVLLQSVARPQVAAPAAGNPAPADGSAGMALRLGEIRLSDPFLMQLFAGWQSQQGLSFELNNWVMRILQGDLVQAAHLWSTIEARVPESFRQDARAAWLYLLWKNDLAQSFFDEWIRAQSDSAFSSSRAALALDQIVSPGFDRWLADHALQLSPEQEAIVRTLDRGRGFHFLTLHAWAALRKGEMAQGILASLPPQHAFKIPLARSVALSLARKGDIAGAARILKTELEPALELKKEPLAMANHHLQVARLLYQAGVLDAAEDFYLKVPGKAPEFLKAREELTWVRLRKGETQKLRGELATLSTGVFSETFQPEVFLVRAISNLKLCLYEGVEKDFADFRRVNLIWAKRIDEALKAGSPPRPSWVDEFGVRAEQAIEARAAEAEKLASLAEASIRVALPAVGPQRHWTRLKERMQAALEEGRKVRDSEYRRQWLARKSVLEEAIRKMQFVKVELGSQLRELARLQEAGRDAVRMSAAGAARVEPAGGAGPAAAKKETVEREAGELVFPFDGVMWPDELFRLRSIARNRCLERGRQ